MSPARPLHLPIGLAVIAAILTLGPAVGLAEQRARTQQRSSAELDRLTRRDGMNVYERKAVQYLKARLRARFPTRLYKLQVHPTTVQYPGNKNRPITGQRPILVDVKVTPKQPSGWARLKHALSGKTKRRFYVQSQRGRRPAVVAEMSLGPLARTLRALPLKERLHDFVNSKGVRDGAVLTGIGAISMEPTAIAAALAVAGAKVSHGLQRRTTARNAMVEKTAKWARESIGKGVTPTAAEAWAFYRSALHAHKPGTHPGTLECFLNKLANHGL